MKGNALKTALAIGLLNASLVFAAPIKNIEILGLNAISRGAVLSYLPVEVGDDYNAKISAQIIRTLYKTQFFKDIEVIQIGKTLKITLVENPSIKYVNLINQSDKVLDKDMIDRVLTSMNLTQGKIFNERQLDKLMNQLQATYTAKGYYNTKITKRVEIDNQNRVGVELDIDEGEVARIKTMHISGNKVESEEDLLDLFEIGEPDWSPLNYFTEKDHYSKVALDAGVEALKSHYIDLGYLDFKILNVSNELSDNKKSIDINIQIEEGSKYKIGAIKFSGELLNESKESLTKLLTIETGNIFERQKIINDIKVITDLYTDQGYAFATVDAVTTENKVVHTIDLNFKVQLKKKVYINRITITGNTRTQDEVVRREIGIYEGGLYSNKELEESIDKIKRLGYFSDVKMNVSKVPGFEDKINLNFVVEETKTGTFSVGLSHSNNSGTSFNLGISEKNFLGSGNTLDASLSSSKAVKEVNFYFLDPYFTPEKHSLSYGIFVKKTDGAKLDVASYKINEKGGSVGYGIPITKDTRISTELKVSSKKITCGTTFFTQESTQCNEYSNKNSTEVKLNLNWSSNTLDDYLFPTKGTTNSVNASIALPVADYKYYKLSTSHKSYRPLSKNITFKVNASISIAQGYGNKELPFFERYYGGGSSSVRGFDFNSLGEKYADTEKAKGGELSVLTGVSLISPLTFIKDSKNMRMSAFIDVGAVSTKASSFNAGDEFRASVGAAFTWLTPVGPLGVYVAKPILKKTGDKTKTFEFTIGTSF
ncbi:outer membrane protein assembly factor BamA [Bathymodiolus septemdierum thioautotrophic gill symbiont]|uniref:Outer membrane protein assembly factor BamA n=1 Tax=endosymbiont of Bathymodiolus septemdierum str. Myojin knoll TaxID=1303921 RepID=A0A0P0USL7_9GAMM|nr:outer membrane protein assembly factor BamA [Bathymodiolus septemdierum thioautotrophic gill symbiont]BAS67891.1 outer membrane protein assembly complex, YaeT protein [endosymbiont of Bathymodiolus septemdierum str. Myojin knoll]